MRGDSHGHSSSVIRRLHARLASWRLDRRLAGGADPREDELLGCRAEQLVEPTLRHVIAEGLRLALARAGRAPFGAAIPVAGPSVEVCAEELLALAERLDAERPVDARGVARARLLLQDGTSPLYRVASPLKLQSALDRALIALGP